MQIFVDLAFKEGRADDRVGATEVYEIYREWHKRFVNPKSIPNIQVFGRQLGAKIRKDKVGGLTWYYGVTLTEAALNLAPTTGK